MKKFLTGLAVASAMLLCVNTQANPLPIDPAAISLNVRTVDQDVLYLRLANLQQAPTFVRLTDLEGNLYFSKRIKAHNGYSMTVNLEKVPSGRYLLTVGQKGKKMSQVIYKGDEQMLISQVANTD